MLLSRAWLTYCSTTAHRFRCCDGRSGNLVASGPGPIRTMPAMAELHRPEASRLARMLVKEYFGEIVEVRAALSWAVCIAPVGVPLVPSSTTP